MTAPVRCPWCEGDALMMAYHDEEWGVPEYDSRALWEKLVLDGFQAGLSWRTILHKRAAFRAAFAGFDPQRVARFEAADIERLLQNPGIVRSRAKIEAAVGSARAYLAMGAAGDDFADFLWSLAGGTPRHNGFVGVADVPAQTAASVAMAQALRARGFRFCGPVIVYAFMQATGMVNDHLTGCYRHRQLATPR